VSVTGEEREVAGLVPPHSEQAEAAVISACLLKDTAVDECLSILRPEHFYDPAKAAIFDAIQSLAVEGKPVDLVTVATWLKDRERLREAGGTSNLASIVDATPAVHNVGEHAQIVVRKSRRRSIIRFAHEVRAAGYGDVGDEESWIADVEARMVSLASGTDSRELVTIGDALRRFYTHFVNEIESKVTIAGGRTGLADLDGLLGPLRPGAVTALGGFWGDGKSALGVQIALNTALEPRQDPSASLVVSCEMTDEELAQRALFLTAGVDSGKARPHKAKLLERYEWDSLAKAASIVTALPVWIDDRPDTNPAAIRTSIRRHKARARKAGQTLRVVVVDYLQLVDGRQGLGKQANREQEVANVARELKKTAKAENVHIVALAQLNDDANKRGQDERRPTSRDFRESKAIPMNADNVILIHNQAARERAKRIHRGEAVVTSAEPEHVELIVDKHRGGPTGTVNVSFHPHLTKFDNEQIS
jgi:replicative DNA helicase